MATGEEYIKYVVSILNGDFSVRYRKMFGEYMIYLDEKPALLVCDNTVFVKIIPETEKLLTNAEKDYPYDGAKLHYIIDTDNTDLFCRVATMLATILPEPKQKNKKG